jgi:hypothetical protein
MSANFSYCERISTQKQRDKCARKVILPCSDAAMSESEKGRCLAWEYSDYKLCADGACLFDYATEFSLMAACDEIKEEGERLTCKSVLSKNPVCSEASQTAVADYCYAQVAERLNESYWCGLASEKSTYKSECIKKLAVMQGNFQICKDADTTIIEDDCYYNYAKSSNAPQACEGIFSETKKDSCYRETALAYRYMSHCNGIVSAYARSLCFSAVAFGNATIKISRGGCADVNDAIWKDKCYMEAAVEWMDKNICKSIAASGVRSSCRSKFI